MRAWWAVAVALLPMLAGCLDPAAPDEPVGPVFTSPDDPIPEEGFGHDHRDPDQHRFARNASVVFHDDLRRFGFSQEQPVGAHAVALQRERGLLAVAVHGAETGAGQQGVHLYDVSEPEAPVHFSFWDATATINGDRTVAWSSDGDVLFLGFEGAGGRPGVAALDVRTPASPLLVGFWDDPTGFGSHTVAAGSIDGVQYVFSLSLGVNILRYEAGAFTFVGKYVTQDELAAADAVGQAVEEGSQTGAQTYALRAVYGHDMNFYLDPVTGVPLLLVAYAYDGAKVLDLSRPAAPVLSSRWMPPADTEHRHYTHSITAERIGDRLVVVVGSETFEQPNQAIASPVWILDATDAVADGLPASRPVHLGTWRNPGGAAAGDLGLSVHFFRQEDGLLYLSHYHGGVWAIDLRTDEARRAPEAFGYLMPVPEDALVPPEECCIGFDLDGVPMVFDVTVQDGTVYAADLVQGLVVGTFSRPA